MKCCRKRISLKRRNGSCCPVTLDVFPVLFQKVYPSIEDILKIVVSLPNMNAKILHVCWGTVSKAWWNTEFFPVARNWKENFVDYNAYEIYQTHSSHLLPYFI